MKSSEVHMFLDGLPKRGKLIDWKNCVGYKVPFKYNDISGEIKIIGYNNGHPSHLIVKYLDNKEMSIIPSSLAKGSIGNIIKTFTSDYKIEIGSEFVDDKRNLLVYSRYTIKVDNKNMKMYSYTCNNCGYHGEHEERYLLRGYGCSCCTGRIVAKGINDVATTHPDLIKYFLNIDDTHKYTANSAVKIELKCPICNYKKIKSINQLLTRGFCCNRCSDGISYSEKFIHLLLEQLNINFINQYSKSNSLWCANFKYDFSVLDMSCIIETHGIQHYVESFSRYGGRTLKQEQDNDNLKMQLAKENGIKHYIILDCRKSELEWIKKSVMESELPTLFNFTESDIDWFKCNEFACNSLVKDVSVYKANNKNETTTTIGKHFKLNRNTILRYLKQGSLLGWC